MEFKRLNEVMLTESATDSANVLIEENGEIKRVPKTQVGGAGGGIATAILRQVNYLDIINGTMEPPEDFVFEPINMTLEEAIATLLSGEPLDIIMMMILDGPGIVRPNLYMTDGESMITMILEMGGSAETFLWTSESITILTE